LATLDDVASYLGASYHFAVRGKEYFTWFILRIAALAIIFGLLLLLALGGTAFGLLSGQASWGSLGSAALGVIGLVVLGLIALVLLALYWQVAVIRGAAAFLRGTDIRPDFDGAWGVVFRMILFALLVVALVIVAVIVGGVLAVATAVTIVLPILIVLALIVLIVALVLASGMGTPAIVLGGFGPLNALREGFAIVRRNPGVLIVFNLILVVIGFALSFIGNLPLQLATSSSQALNNLPVTAVLVLIGLVIYFVINTVVSLFTTAAGAIAYYNLVQELRSAPLKPSQRTQLPPQPTITRGVARSTRSVPRPTPRAPPATRSRSTKR